MKFIWEESDIKAGRVLGRKGTEERHMIGYFATDHCGFVLVCISDGFVVEPRTAEVLCGHLTRNEYVPEEFLKYESHVSPNNKRNSSS